MSVIRNPLDALKELARRGRGEPSAVTIAEKTSDYLESKGLVELVVKRAKHGPISVHRPSPLALSVYPELAESPPEAQSPIGN